MTLQSAIERMEREKMLQVCMYAYIYSNKEATPKKGEWSIRIYEHQIM